MEYLIIQVEESRVTAGRFQVAGKSATSVSAAEFALDGDHTLASVAAQIAEGSTGAPRIVLCLAPSLFAQRAVELPLTDMRKVREILPVHLQGEMALPAEEAVFDAVPAGHGAYLALWAKRADIDRGIAVFRDAGIEPQIVSATPLAWRFLPALPADCAVCDGSALAIISEGNLTFVRSFSGAEPEKQLASTLLTLELSGTPLPSRLVVFGPQAAALAGLEDVPLAVEQLQLPEELGHLFRNEGTFQQLAGLYAVARASHAGALPDFRRGDLAWTAGSLKARKQLVVTASLAALMVLLLFVHKGMQYRAIRTDLTSVNNSISAIYREIFPTRAKAVDEVAEIKGEIRKLTAVQTSGGVLDVLKQLADAKGNSINGLYEAEVEGNALRVKGDARSAQAANEFKAALAPLMTTIELGEVKSRPDGSVSFSLSGTLKEVKK
ncbi:MAG TPA: type II secretion system protein GspL [Desulfuromonadaceae bacterium]